MHGPRRADGSPQQCIWRRGLTHCVLTVAPRVGGGGSGGVAAGDGSARRADGRADGRHADSWGLHGAIRPTLHRTSSSALPSPAVALSLLYAAAPPPSAGLPPFLLLRRRSRGRLTPLGLLLLLCSQMDGMGRPVMASRPTHRGRTICEPTTAAAAASTAPRKDPPRARTCPLASPVGPPLICDNAAPTARLSLGHAKAIAHTHTCPLGQPRRPSFAALPLTDCAAVQQILRC